MRKSIAVVVAGMSLGVLLTGAAAMAEEAASASTNQAAAVVGKPQTTCPVTGDAINKKFYTDYEGKRIYFCCNMCPKMFAKDPEKYMKKMKEAGIVSEDAPAK